MQMNLVNTKNKIFTSAIIILAVISIATLTQFIRSALANSTGNLLPSADGTYLQWNPSLTSTTHYTLVDEPICNGITDFNYTNTTGTRDSYAVSLTSTPDNATITSINITPCASRNLTGVGAATMKVFYRYNGINSADGGNYILASTTIPVVLTSTNFGGLSLVKTPSSSLEIGAVLASGDKGARLSQIMVNVTYNTSTFPPTVSSTGAVSTTQVKTNLKGSANPNGNLSTGWFRYSITDPGTCNDTFGIRVPASGGINLGSGNSFIPYSYSVASLTPNTTYYYCAIASNVWGTGVGLVMSFTTLP
jgi:hypothetical protein